MDFREGFVYCSFPAFGFLLLSGYRWRDRLRKLLLLVAWLYMKSSGTKNWRSLSTARRLKGSQRDARWAPPWPPARPRPEVQTLPVRVRKRHSVGLAGLDHTPSTKPEVLTLILACSPLQRGQWHCPVWVSISKGQLCLPAFWWGNVSLQGLRKACL